MTKHPDQLGFDGLLNEAEAANDARRFEKTAGHLPDTLDEAISYHRAQIADHHAAMLACDFDTAMRIRDEAHLLARKLNGGNPGILATEDSPGSMLGRSCAAEPGAVPLWGQDGAFEIEAAGMALRVSMGGMFSICAGVTEWLGFEVRAVDPSKPFLSETGYRSFLGVSVAAETGMNVEGFVRRVIEVYVTDVLNGRLRRVSKEYRGSQ